MKKLFLLMLVIPVLLISCKKPDIVGPTPVPNTILLSAIIDNNQGDGFFYEKPLLTLAYNGTQLAKSVMYGFDSTSTSTYKTNTFSYNSQGQLTGTKITYTIKGNIVIPDSVPVSCTVTYSGNYISEFKFFTSKNLVYDDAQLTWQNGALTSITDVANSAIAGYSGENYTYSYDSNGNDTADGTNNTFDNKNNITRAFPLWMYFLINTGPATIFSQTPGKNNITGFVSYNYTYYYNYQYNSYGFPSEITTNYSSEGIDSYTYQYIQVK